MEIKWFRLLVVVCFVQLVHAETMVLDTVSGVYENVSYQLEEEDDALVLTLVTSNKAKVRQLIRRGTVFYFDVKGKKNKTLYVRYPVPGKPSEMGERPSSDEEGPDLGLLLADLPQEGEYAVDGETELFHPMLNSLGIEIALEPTMVENEEGVEEGLLYRLRIPKAKIGDDLSRLSIGVASGQRPDREEGASSVGGKPSLGMGGGGRGGGGRRGGGRRGSGGSQRPDGQGEGPVVKAIDFWFDADL